MSNKEIISDKQGISLIIMFIIGTASIMARGLDAKQDLWLAVIIALIGAFPIVFIYAYLQYIFPGKDLFDIIYICFGNVIGKGIIIIYTWFLFHTGILVCMNFTNFVWIVALLETPKIILMISMIVLCTWIIKEGIEVMGRWAEFFVCVLVGFIFIAILFLIPKMHIKNIQPILNSGIKPFIKGTFSVFTFPFTQIIPFMIIFSNFKAKKSPYKIYLLGLLLGAIVILINSLGSILVLGVSTATGIYYPAYGSASRIGLGAILQRIEIIIATTFTLGAFIKAGVYLLATCKGISKIFKYNDYRFIVVPVSLLMINLSYFLHDSVMDYFEWILGVWTYYAFPFQIVFPIVILIVAKIRKKIQEV
ncbi:GerAB/ArcD/ProY family transporter [Crassaminicella thermophila]|uniref:GerAB/ArcD/ProY family transporter n=1 Tax=Crassaminicella thermophila TaxID=2599308 RepID=A0A5C0SAM2_CRATE|nr:endospore germination permease [Crassaminicella thermophila]QEK11221.1 GerAB/ArcD/ProY family transporter [Crassaminicella thermophila]